MDPVFATSWRRPVDKERKEIRLLTYQSEMPPPPQAILEFTISHVALTADNVPQYHAISYTWDTTPQRELIMLDGIYTTVSTSAEQTLRGLLQAMSRSNLSLRASFWIDAISVDQDNLAEKSWQVGQMGMVYACATSTLAWLGDDDGTTPAAMRTLELLAQDSRAWQQKSGLLLPHYTDTGTGCHGEMALKELTTPLPDFCDWQALRSLLSCRWFGRLWILQEIALARRIHCFRGHYTISWSDLSDALRWIDHRDWGLVNSVGHHISPATHDLFFEVHLVTPLLEVSERYDHFDPGNLVLLNLGRDASNHYDKVFDLLGLTDSESFPIIPDYTRPLKDIYTDATYYAARHENQNLELLILDTPVLPFTALELEDWPSWTARVHLFRQKWTLIGANMTLIGRYIDDIAGTRGLEAHDGHVAPVERPTADVLRIKAVRLAEIKSILLSPLELRGQEPSRSSGPLTGEQQDTVASYFSRLWSDHFFQDSQLQWSVPTFVTIARVLGLTTRAASSTSSFAALVESAKPSNAGHTSTSLSQALSECRPQRGRAALSAAVASLILSNANVSLVVLTDGSIGSCVGDIAVGDTVFVFLGSRIPFVLRQSEDEWRLSGAAKVPHVSEGRFIRQLHETGQLDAATETIDLH